MWLYIWHTSRIHDSYSEFKTHLSYETVPELRPAISSYMALWYLFDCVLESSHLNRQQLTGSSCTISLHPSLARKLSIA